MLHGYLFPFPAINQLDEVVPSALNRANEKRLLLAVRAAILGSGDVPV